MNSGTGLIMGWMLALAPGCFGALKPVTLELTRDGQPQATIVLADKPTRAAQLAAAELQEHLRRISGATLPIVSDTNAVKGVRLLVGESAATRKLGWRNQDFKPQEYLIQFRRKTLVLMGRDKEDYGQLDYRDPDDKTLPDIFDEQGTCYAVYDFLERFCEVRWYLPGDLGTVVPEMKTLRVSGTERRRQPWMEYRVIAHLQEKICHASGSYGIPYDLVGAFRSGDRRQLSWRDQALYAHRLRTGGRRITTGGHSFYGYYQRFWKKSPEYAQYFEQSHPEFFARGYDDWAQPPQMCYTDPALVHQVVKDAGEFFDGKEPRVIINEVSTGNDYFAIGPMDDCANWCRCPRCQAAIYQSVPRGSPLSTKGCINDYLDHFINQVAREVRQTHPQKMLSAMSYNACVYPPTREKLEPNVAMTLCLNPRDVWHVTEYKGDSVHGGTSWRDILASWVQESKERPKYLYMYYENPAEEALEEFSRRPSMFWYPFPGFFAHRIPEQMQVYRKAGIRGMYIQTSTAPPGIQLLPLWDQLESYVTLQLADDPEKDGLGLIDEMFRRYYGNAARPMKAFYEMVEEIFGNPNNYPQGAVHQTPSIAWECLGTEWRMEKLGRLMAEARAACRTETEKQRVALFDRGIWQVMCAGRDRYQTRKTQADATMQSGRAPRCPMPAEQDPRKVDWTRTGVLGNWRSSDGQPTAREIEARVAHDGAHLYLRLQERLDPAKIVHDGGSIWTEDDWEIFVARRGSDDRYRQMGIDLQGKHQDLAFSSGSSAPWQSGAQVYSDAGSPGYWSVYVALPFDRLLDGGSAIEAGEAIYLNLVRATQGKMDSAAMWIPTLAPSFHSPDRLGKVVLEK